MDDKIFDRKSALDWIGRVESEKARVRDTDIYPLLNKWILETTPREILEIGCGQGACSNTIDLPDRLYIGVEPSQFLLDRAQELYSRENRHFVAGSAYALPFGDNGFDAVFSVSVWHLLSDLQKAAAELSRVLRESGVFLIITANPDAYSEWTREYTECRLHESRFEGSSLSADGAVSRDVLYLHTKDEIINSLRNFGLNVGGIETFRPSHSIDGEARFIAFRGCKSVAPITK